MITDSTVSKLSTASTDTTAIIPGQRWRDLLPVHPAAEMFPLMTAAELQELAADIAAHGLRERVELYNDHELDVCLLDGRNRLDALELLGWKIFNNDEGYPSPQFFSREHMLGVRQPDPWAYVVSRNFHRRHLSPEQRRDVIAKILKADPGRSNRQVATLAGVDHKTVAAVRAEGESTGEIPQLEKTKGKDGKDRPARRPGSSRDLIWAPLATSAADDPETSAAARKAQYAADEARPRSSPKSKAIPSLEFAKTAILREAVKICADRCRRLP
jgi:hypothetical protein